MTQAHDASYQLLGARYVRKHVKGLVEQLKGACRGGDIEYVHQARVASRRLRAGFRFFDNCFGTPHIKRWRKAVRRVTRLLGPARDADVQIAFVRDALERLPAKALRPGVKRLLLRLAQRREALQPDLRKGTECVLASGILAQMRRAANRQTTRLKKRGVSLASPLVFRIARDHVVARWDELRQWQDSLKDPNDYDRHHRMRISAKRLRYTLEICSPAYDGALNESIDAVKALQELLGDIHDCDVWVEQLQRFLEAERQRTLEHFGHTRPFNRLKAGIQHLNDERLAHRRQAFDRLAAEWGRLAETGLWTRLLGVLEIRLRPAAVTAPVAQLPAAESAPEAPAPPAEPDRRPAPMHGTPPRVQIAGPRADKRRLPLKDVG
jgi:CHAD domain-containing protein